MTLTVLKGSGQEAYRMSLNSGMSGTFSELQHGCGFGEKATEMMRPFHHTALGPELRSQPSAMMSQGLVGRQGVFMLICT